MSTYHYDGSPCPESCTCAVREVDRLRTQLEAVTRERDGARAQLDEAVSLAHESRVETVRARADAARMREALTQVRDAMRATGQEPDGDDDPRRPVATAVWHALASAPSTEPTPRDMRVAKVTP